jgi:hypothetical protein
MSTPTYCDHDAECQTVASIATFQVTLRQHRENYDSFSFRRRPRSDVKRPVLGEYSARP